jgi:hypothetical protein
MKQLIKLTVIAGCAFVVSALNLLAQTNPIITLDEFGVGTINGAPLPGVLGPDPSGGVTTSPVLIYTLPFPVFTGDVLLISSNEPPDSPSFPISDLIRFWNGGVAGNSNQTQVIFYSDFSPTDPPDAPADTGLPRQFLTPTVTIPEVGPETGPNGALYVPPLGGPGFNPGLFPQYQINSDAVPEPGSAALVLSGLSILCAVNRYGRQRFLRNR